MTPPHHTPGSGLFSLFRHGVEGVAARLAFFPPTPPTYDVLPAQKKATDDDEEDPFSSSSDCGDDGGDDPSSSSLSAEPRRHRRHHCCSHHRNRRKLDRRTSNSFFFYDKEEGQQNGRRNSSSSKSRLHPHHEEDNEDEDEDGGGDPREDARDWPGGDGEHRRRRALNNKRLEIVPVDPRQPAVSWKQARVSYVRVPRGVPRGAGGGATVAGGYDIVVAFVPFYFVDGDNEGGGSTAAGGNGGSGSSDGENEDAPLHAPHDQQQQQGGAAAAAKTAAAAATATKKHHHRHRARCTILYSHGNATDLGQVLPFCLELSRELKANVVCYDYAGYGRCGGRAGVSNALADAAAALRHAREKYNVDEADVVLYGQSVGSGPSVWLAARRSTARLRWRREAERAARRLQRQAVRDAARGGGLHGGGNGADRSSDGSSTSSSTTLSAALSLQRILGGGTGGRRGSLDRASWSSFSSAAAGGAATPPRSSEAGDDNNSDAYNDDDDPSSSSIRPPGVAGLVLHSPIASGVRVLAPGLRHWPAPFDVFPNAHLIRRVTACPTLVIHGTADAVVDATAGLRLAELAPRPSLPPLFVRGAGHDDVAASPLYLPRLRSFLAECFPEGGEYQQ
jgi:pimeloyl-ACP methyl ester carboxylesterase